MYNTGKPVAPFFAYTVYQNHVFAFVVVLEEQVGIFGQYCGCKGTKIFTKLYFRVNKVPDMGHAGVGQYAAVAQCTRAQFGAIVEPAYGFAGGQFFSYGFETGRWCLFFYTEWLFRQFMFG